MPPRRSQQASQRLLRAAPAEKTLRLRLSASSINFRDLPIESACQKIASLGFSHRYLVGIEGSASR